MFLVCLALGSNANGAEVDREKGSAKLSKPKSSAPPPPSHEALAPPLKSLDQDAIASMLASANFHFQIPAELQIDEELRSAATAIAEEHKSRLGQLIKVWIGEERLAEPSPLVPTLVHWRVSRRFYNEFALWRLDSLGAGHDKLWLRIAHQAKACRAPEIQVSPFARVVLAIQSLPKEDRSAALAAETALLRRWGTHRGELAARPALSAQDWGLKASSQLALGGNRQLPAMPPILASHLLDDQSRENFKQLNWGVRCALAQWRLRAEFPDVVNLEPSNSKAQEALAIFRYESMPELEELVFIPELPKTSRQDYPYPASGFGVEGVVRLNLEFDLQGSLISVQVSQRQITVQGIRKDRPVLFETLLDQAALNKAKASKFNLDKTAFPDPARPLASQQYVFKINP